MSSVPWWTWAGRSRPKPIPQTAIAPPFDPSDSGGIVHTTLPPEQVIPPHFTDPTWIRADFNGVTLPGSYTPTASAAIVAAGGVTMTSGRWAGLFVPWLVGANTTPPTMLMTPMLPLYPRSVQDAVLTEHALRGYDDLIYDCAPWNAAANGRGFTPAAIVAFSQYVRSWGFRPVLWRGDPTQGCDAMFQTIIQQSTPSLYVHGEEVDSKMTSEAYEASLQLVNQYLGGRVPIGVHFTADGNRQMGYPIGFPRDTFLNDWSPYDGRVHLCEQLDGDASAGLQGASMYYARRYVNAGLGDGAQGPGAPHSRVIAWETMATKQLYGQCTEAYGCLRSWELLCGTRDNPACLPVSGFGNGARYPNGDPL